MKRKHSNFNFVVGERYKSLKEMIYFGKQGSVIMPSSSIVEVLEIDTELGTVKFEDINRGNIHVNMLAFIDGCFEEVDTNLWKKVMICTKLDLVVR